MAPPQVFRLRPNLRRLPNPSMSNFFSFSSTSDSQDTNTPSSESREEPSRTFNSPPNPPSGVSDILKNISLTRNRNASSPGPPSGVERSFHPSLEELFKRNEMSMSKGDGRNSETTQPATGKLNFDAIREKLRNQNQNQNMNRSVPRSRFSDILKMRPNNDSNARESPLVIGGSDHLPASIFGREMRDKRDRNSSVESSTSMKFVKTYEFKELGEKLTKLRPEKKLEKNWFSIGELNDRLMKVWEKEKELWEMEKATNPASGNMFKELRGALVQLQISNDEQSKKTMIQRLDVLGSLGGTPKFMLHPPKAHLLEKYLHPDNLSSEEKMKLELQKVRDEFKMSESDCGSSRVQVAQLTTKIKYLSGVLHKKDKHSRKGLQAMVQKRKKLLKYLRRTDWDSYCLVLSKLGLRDNPDYKL